MSGGDAQKGRDGTGRDGRGGRDGTAGIAQKGRGWAYRGARGAVWLYPGAWRERYGDEVRALLEDSGADLRTVASLVWRAGSAWVLARGHLYGREGRMRASLATTGMAWAVLAGLAVLFVQLTQAQPSLEQVTAARHPVMQWAFWVFDGAVGLSVLAVLVGGVPLFLEMWRLAMRRGGRGRGWLLAPLVGPVGFAAVALVVGGLVRRPHRAGGITRPGQAISVVDLANGMLGPWWFLVLVVLGLMAAGVSAAGPGVALRRLRPDGSELRLAARATGLAAASMAVAGAASIGAAIGLYRWAPPEAGYHQEWLLALFLPVVALAAAVAVVSSARGVWAARSGAGGEPAA